MATTELRLLFWNMRRQAQAIACAVDLCAEHRPHVLLTAESPDGLLGELHRQNPEIRQVSVDERVRTFVVHPGLSVRRVRGSRYGEAFELSMPSLPTHLLVGVHVESSLWQPSPDDQGLTADEVHKFIEEAEKDVQHDRTIAIGDFNMDPFTPAMVDIRGLNAMLSLRTSRRGARTVGGVKRKMFYNPMWGLLGDRENPPASYYFKRTGARGYYWHMLDQVLLRSSVSTAEPAVVSVLTATRNRALLTARAGHPDRAVSDHLPLFARLNLCAQVSDT